MSNDNNYIWIFGENRGLSASENSFNFWRHCLSKDDNVDDYLVLVKNENTLNIYNTLSANEKKHVLWHNSKKHKEMFKKADLCFVSDSFKDVCPTKGPIRKVELPIEKSLIFLQKDTGSLFETRFTGESQNNNIFRFCVYEDNLEELKKSNNFKDYQLRHVKYPLKFDREFIDEFESNDDAKSIIWNVEWRYYENIRANFVDNLVDVLKSDRLNDYLKQNGIDLKVYLHRYYKMDMFSRIFECANDNIQIIEGNVIARQDIVDAKLLITDYSSYSYDFTLLRIPVVLYQPDFDYIRDKHQLSVDINELARHSIYDKDELISTVISNDYGINPVFEIWDENSFDEIKTDSHIDELYEYFLEKQENKITFLGYNFFGAGGTVSSTKALAEGLMQQDYLVELYSILRTNTNNSKPYGINFRYGFYRHTASFKDKLTYKIHGLTKNYGYLSHESNLSGINPYSRYHIKKTLKNIKSNTVVSTRETLHLFLEECTSEFVKNKLYFFHAPADTIDVMYPGMIAKLSEKTLKKTIFVTEENRLKLKELFGYDNYNQFLVIGNALEENKIIDKDKIQTVPKKDKYFGIYLLRLSDDRIDDLNNLIEFGKYLKANNISNIVIDVFGGGLYAETFVDDVNRFNLDNIINYRGRTNVPFNEIQNHDFMADFTLNHSFGMIYIEGVLAGRKVFCMENPGSIEVMEGIDNSYIESFEWLVGQINSISDISLEELHRNYDIVFSKYSQNAVSRKFLDYLD